ncbi:MAG: 2-hydroxychromene-2-carboxylate isomerase [Burkholderiaceae bacterium]
MRQIECFYDCSSPWTYLCVHNLPALAARPGATIVWRPFLVGGVFNAVNPSVYQSRQTPVPAKAAYLAKSITDWARLAGLAIHFPPPVFPVNSVKAMRACLWLDDPARQHRFALAVFDAYFGRGLDISQDDVLREVCERTGEDADAVFAGIALPGIKDGLRANTDELIARGGFGSPTMFVNDTDMYFGNDALPLVEAALARLGQAPVPQRVAGHDPRA